MFGLTKRVAMIILSVWLITTGLFALGDITFGGADLLLNLLAIAAGGLILWQGKSWSTKIGMILLGAWLLAEGLLGVLPVAIPNVDLIMDLVAIAAGVLILLKR